MLTTPARSFVLSRVLIVACSAAALGGCVRYEYDVVEPPDLSQRVGSKAPVRFPIGELEYRLQTSDNRLVMLIYNRADEPVKLLGEDSFVVDPGGESHPLDGRTIPPGSHVKLILPPAPAQVRTRGSTFGFGIGVGYSRAYHGRRGFGYGGSLHDDFGPRYYNVYDPNDATFWRWEGETDARLVLVYERGDERFTDEFRFHRKRV